MALVSPPKPWQRSQPDAIQTSTSPSPTSKPAAASPTIVQQPTQTTTSTSSGLYQPNSFGYGPSSMGYSSSTSNTYLPSSSYGSSSYGSPPYHGMYGYGSSYGGHSGFASSYGSPYSPAYSQWGVRPYHSGPYAGQHLDAYKGTPVNFLVSSGHAFMSGMQQHVSTFGRFSQILHMNLDALQMSFSSILQLLTNASMLRHELSAFFGTFGSIRAIYLLYVKLRHMMLRLIGRQHDARKLEFEGFWQDSNQGRWGWMPTFLTLSLAVMIIRKFIQFLSNSNSWRSHLATRSDPESIPPSFWPNTAADRHSWQSTPVPGQPATNHLMSMNPPAPVPMDPSSPFNEAFSGAFSMPHF